VKKRLRFAVIGSLLTTLLMTAPVPGGSEALADEPLFGFLYTTDTLPQGQKEVEQWMTWRHGKAHGYYDQLENRTEFSYGVTDAFQLSGYLNYNWTRAYHNAVDGTTTLPEQFSDYNVSPNDHFSGGRFIGVSLEGIYRVLSPYEDPIGLAFYLEPTVGTNFDEIEGRTIFQKDFLDDRLVTDLNLTWAPEFRPPVRPVGDVETDINWGVGASYRFVPRWYFGWEFQNEREMNGLSFFNRSSWTNDAYYTGPVIHYGGEHFFATLSVWNQLPFAYDYANAGVLYHGRDYDIDFEQFRSRLKVGWYF
jgi:Family of unknown function (DUF6662)